MEISQTIEMIKQGKKIEFPVEFKAPLLEYFQKRLEAELIDIEAADINNRIPNFQQRKQGNT